MQNAFNRGRLFRSSRVDRISAADREPCLCAKSKFLPDHYGVPASWHNFHSTNEQNFRFSHPGRCVRFYYESRGSSAGLYPGGSDSKNVKLDKYSSQSGASAVACGGAYQFAADQDIDRALGRFDCRSRGDLAGNCPRPRR